MYGHAINIIVFSIKINRINILVKNILDYANLLRVRCPTVPNCDYGRRGGVRGTLWSYTKYTVHLPFLHAIKTFRSNIFAILCVRLQISCLYVCWSLQRAPLLPYTLWSTSFIKVNRAIVLITVKEATKETSLLWT